MYNEECMVRQKGRAKINLMLDVQKNRGDGFHEVSMIMQSLRLWDSITIRRKTREEESTLSCNLPFLKADDRNIAWKAWKLMKERYSIEGEVEIRIFKKIPIAAGLAGGSTDAAAVIRCINQLFHLYRRREELLELGAELGSDVPFCIQGGTCLAYGRGERLQRISPLPQTSVILVKPDFSISTKWSYDRFDSFANPPHPDWRDMDRRIAQRRIELLQEAMINSLELPAIDAYPMIEEIKQRLHVCGADASSMSGSGPTVFGLFRSADSAEKAYRTLRSELPGCQVILTNTENPQDQMGGEWIFG